MEVLLNLVEAPAAGAVIPAHTLPASKGFRTCVVCVCACVCFYVFVCTLMTNGAQVIQKGLEY